MHARNFCPQTWTAPQVSIAVLLDNFLAASNRIKEEEARQAVQTSRGLKRLSNPLDPLLLQLSKEYAGDGDLSARLQNLFKVGGRHSRARRIIARKSCQIRKSGVNRVHIRKSRQLWKSVGKRVISGVPLTAKLRNPFMVGGGASVLASAVGGVTACQSSAPILVKHWPNTGQTPARGSRRSPAASAMCDGNVRVRVDYELRRGHLSILHSSSHQSGTKLYCPSIARCIGRHIVVSVFGCISAVRN
jgi:hypothetical protein